MVRVRSDSYSGRLWLIPEPADHTPIPDTPYPPFVTRLLHRRAVYTAEDARRFLFEIEEPPPDATLLPGAPAALDRLEAAIRRDESIAVYGDFDVDGVTAAVILTEAIRGLGGRVTPYIPDRFREGYGVHTEALQRLHAQHGVTLVITADCGMSAAAEIDAARGLGMDTVVVDHHSAPDRLPDAVALVNPQLPDSRYPNRDLASGAIAYRLAPTLWERFGRSVERDRWVDLAALSTVADVAPLRGENRWIVRAGLEAMQHSDRPGLRALLDVAGLSQTSLGADSIAFGLAPRLNAAGRLDSAMLAFQCLIEEQPDRAGELAARLDRLNRERRRLTEQALACATDRLRSEDPDSPLTFVGAPELPSGVLGLVAGRLREDRYRPTVIYTEEPDTHGAHRGRATARPQKITHARPDQVWCRASCRSIPEFDIAAALRACADLLERHGGHSAAAGFTARGENMPALKARLIALAAEQLAGVPLRPRLDLDAQVPLQALHRGHTAWLERLAPFGEANPAPTFLSPGLTVVDCSRVGADQAHLRLTLRAGDACWPGIAFRQGGAPCRPGDRVDAVWTLQRNPRDGALELEVLDLAPPEADRGRAMPVVSAAEGHAR